jgi:hypothetical protein
MRKGDIKAEVNHKITLLNLAQEDILLDDINIVSQNIYNNKKLSQSGRISIGKVQSTIPINNISASFNLSNLLAANRSFTLRDLKANILEAKVSLKQLNSPFAVLQGNSVLVFSELPLNNVLALEQQPSLTGKGTLAGKLPFRFDGQQLWINDGKITSTDNGYIRYSANAKVKALAASNAGLEIALKVLENFQYKLLSIGVSYQPSGDLLLKNKLSGNNPDWQRGQPIDFSINIEENVLQLLKTLQFSNNLNDKIQDKIQQSQ